MAISYPVTFPEIDGKTIIQKMSMRLVHSASMTESPINFKQLVLSHDMAKWEAEVTIRPLNHTEAKLFSAFLASLRGMEKEFLMGDPSMKYDTAPDVQSGSTQTAGATMIGIDNNSNQTLKAGSQFEVGGRLYMLLEDAPPNSYNFRDIAPRLHVDVGGSTQLDFNEPKSKWRLATNDIDWSIDKSLRYSFTFSCIQVV